MHTLSQFELEYEKLNTAQRKAVDTVDGPVLVVAGPGTGKTQVLALRVANILKQGNVSPHNILCLTFTENGAVNMRERLHRYIGQDAYRVSIFTFHAFANVIISRYPEFFFNAATYTQATDLDRAHIMEELFRALPHDHPLQSYHPEMGFVYLRDTMDRIKHIKSGGYTPDEYAAVIEVFAAEYEPINEILLTWPERLSRKNIGEVSLISDSLREQGGTTGMFLSVELTHAIHRAEEEGKMEAVSGWKTRFTVKDGDRVLLKDAYNLPKMRAVAEIYRAYVEMLHARGLYDYDDMIIEAVRALREQSVLRNEIEEQYQYILVDEFQDTNDAQMNLVRAITAHPVHEGRPNVMVVGDDDQAIYKFQGAEISNIIHFRDQTFRDVVTIVLDENYRSHQHILDYARGVVTQGIDRLEGRYEDIKKVLHQGNTTVAVGRVTVTRHDSDVEEFASVAKQIRTIIDSGGTPEEIAVIARNHRELKQLLPYLDREDIPYEYTKKANVFDEPHIMELILFCEYVSSCADEGTRKDHLLPHLLSFPYWNISRATLFEIAIRAKDEHRSWASVIGSCDDASVARAYAVISALAIESASLPLEHLLDRYMSESGFRDHYFGKRVIKEHPVSYVHFLASLKTFIEALREWRAEDMLRATDVAPFIATHRDHGVSLISESPFVKAEHAVQVMSAHAAKGLEFETVFIVAAHDELWTGRPHANKAPIPSPLVPLITPAGDTEDDFIRLLYVALTRAKQGLFISGHKELVRYLDDSKGGAPEKRVDSVVELDIEAHESALSLVALPYHEDEWAVLRRVVTSYRMSPTHLNNFLDVIEGGPLHFVEQNLLQFPQPKSVSAVFGTAIHVAIEEFVKYPKWNAGAHPSLERVLQIFRMELAKGRLLPSDHVKQEKRGSDLLTRYAAKHGNEFHVDDEIEVNMKDEGVVVDGAVLSGKLDLLRVENGAYVVRDWKTGKSVANWDEKGKAAHEKVKLHKYQQQLLFYKLLIEHSVHYRRPIAALELEFVEGVLLDGEAVRLSYVPTKEEQDRFERLIGAVYRKITTLDFPDITRYEKSINGIIAFEDDLISGTM